MRGLLILVLLAAPALLAACTSKELAPTCAETACTTPTPTYSAGPNETPTPGDPNYVFFPESSGFPPLPVNESARTLRLEECIGFSGGVLVPVERLEARVPPEFNVAPGIPTETHGIVFIFGQQCKRFVGESLVEEYRELVIVPWLDPKNTSWDPEDDRSLLIWAYFTDSPIAVRALKDLSIPAQLGTFTVDPSEPESGPERWAIDDGNETYEITFYRSSTDGPSTSSTEHYWIEGAEGFLRADLAFAFDTRFTVPQGAIVMSGNGRLEDAVGSKVADLQVIPTLDFDQSISIQTEFFQD